MGSENSPTPFFYEFIVKVLGIREFKQLHN